MDNKKRTRLRSQAPMSNSVPTKILVITNRDTLLQRRSGDIVEVEVEGEHARGLPVVRGVNKRKRDPRGPGGRRLQQKLESEEGSVTVYVDDENANNSASGGKTKRNPGDAPLSRRANPDSKASPQVCNSTYVNIIPEIMSEDQAMMKQLSSNDKRRESSRLRIKPSKFREGFLLNNNMKPKSEHKGAAEDGSSSLEIVLPMDTTHSNTGARADIHPKASSSSDFTSSSFERPGQTSAGNDNKFKITYKLGSSKGPERRASAIVSSSIAKKAADDNELKTALAVVKRVMQIKSAEPFNEPVDPIALEIPIAVDLLPLEEASLSFMTDVHIEEKDYFDVITEPMDLGTIRELLEASRKYKTALDVYADVQLVWSNCRSYNQEGDPIMDILRIAETVFNKHWNVAGLPVLPSSSKSSKVQKMEESDEMESSDELVGALEQGRRDQEKCRKSKDTRVVAEPNLQKVVQFDTPNSRAKIKRSASVEQIMAESKAREDKLEVNITEITNNDSNFSHEYADDEVADKEQTPEKDEDGDFIPGEIVDTQAEGVALEEVIAMKDSEEEQAEAEKPAEQELKTPVQARDNAVHASSSNKRRTFGTVHHKPDCSCVVCVGRRRKLAREEKEGIVEGKKEDKKKHKKAHRPPISQDTPQSDKTHSSRVSDVIGRFDCAIWNIGLSLQLRPKGLTRCLQRSIEALKEIEVRRPPKLPQNQGEAMTVTPSVALGREVVEPDQPDTQKGNTSEVEATVDPCYYPATDDLPMRKVTPSFLRLSQVLFGKPESNVWRRHHSLGCRLPPSWSTRSMFVAVHLLTLSER